MGIAFTGNYYLFYPLLLILGVLAVYFPILGNDFLYQCDDQLFVMNQYTEGGLNWQNLWEIFTTFIQGQYAPLNAMYYLILYSVFRYNPFWFHFASLLLHATYVCLVYICIKRLLELNPNFSCFYVIGRISNFWRSLRFFCTISALCQASFIFTIFTSTRNIKKSAGEYLLFSACFLSRFKI